MRIIILLFLLGFASAATLFRGQIIFPPSTNKPKVSSTETFVKGESYNFTVSSVITVTSNNKNYGPAQVKQDILKLISRLDEVEISDGKMLEIVTAIMNAAARYYPDLPTRKACRLIIGDIYAESGFIWDLNSGGNMESGRFYGLMQVPLMGKIKEFDLFKKHHNFAGLLDWATSKQMDPNSLTPSRDVLRPWVNIHLAVWIQSNFGRTGGLNPSEWGTEQKNPLPRTVKTGLGSWNSGPVSNDGNCYKGSNDLVSSEYFKEILFSISDLYEERLEEDFLDTELTPGLLYYI